MRRDLIIFCFKNGEKQFIGLTKFRTTWTDDENKFKRERKKFKKNCLLNTYAIIFGLDPQIPGP